MPIRTKEERRALHTTPQKKVRSDSDTKQGNTTKITRSGKKLYQETTIDGQKLYHELKTDTSASTETGQTQNIESLTIIGGATTGAAAAATSHNGLTHITADQHHNHQHSIISATDHSGLGAPTGTGNLVFSSSPVLVTPTLGAALATSIDVGASILATRSLTVDTGGVFNIVLASEAGDDFTVDTDKLVVEGDSGNVGIGTASPDTLLHLKSSTTTEPTIRIENTHNDTNSPNIVFFKNPADNQEGDNDVLGTIRFKGQDDGDVETEYATIYAVSSDVTGGTEDGRIHFRTIANSTLDTRMVIDSKNVGIGTAAPATYLHVNGNSNISSGEGAHATAGHIILSNSQNRADGQGSSISWLGSTKDDVATPNYVQAEIVMCASNGTDDRADGMFKFRVKDYWDHDGGGAAWAMRDALIIKHDGKVGIGTTAPSKALTVSGTNAPGDLLLVRNDTDQAVGNGDALGAIYFGADPISNETNQYGAIIKAEGAANWGGDDDDTTDSPSEMTFWTAADTAEPTQRMVIDKDGKVGIGTTAPGRKLTIGGSGEEVLEIVDSGDNDKQRVILGESSANGGYLVLKDESETSTAVIRSYASSNVQAYFTAGNVGIGTTGPVTQLDIGKATGGTLSLTHGVSGANETITDGDILGTLYFGGYGDGHTAAVQHGAMIRGESGGAWDADQLYDAPAELQFFTQGDGVANDHSSPRMTIDHAGRVGIGETQPDTTLEVLSGTTNQLKLSYADGTDTTFGTDTNGWLTIQPSGSKVLIANSNSIGSSSFASGFVGHGWIVDDGNDPATGNQGENTSANATFDNLAIRGTLSVYELLIQQIRCTNGSLLISSVAKVESSNSLSASDDDGTITFESTTDGPSTCPFLVNDIIMCQRVNPGAFVAPDALGNATNVIKKMVYKVTGISANVATVTNIGYNNIETNGPVEGDDFVRIGNTGTPSRQSVMYLTSDDTNAPFIDMKGDLDTYAAWSDEDSTKLRLGRLDGLTAGGDNEYGLWAGPSSTNYIKAGSGGVFIKGSEATYLKATANTIEFFDTNKKMDITSNSIKMYADNGSTVRTEWDNTTLVLGRGVEADPTNYIDCMVLSTSGAKIYGGVNTNFVEIDSNSVTIAASNVDYLVIDSDGMDIYENSQLRCIFGATTVIGSSGGAVTTSSTNDCIRIDSNGVKVFNDAKSYTSMIGTALEVYAPNASDNAAVKVASFGSEIDLYDNTDGTPLRYFNANAAGVSVGKNADAGSAVINTVKIDDTGGVYIYGDHTSTYSLMSSSGLEVFKNGVTNAVAKFSDTTVIGDVAQNNIEITATTLKLRDATTAIITLNNDGTASFNSSISVGSNLDITGFMGKLTFSQGTGAAAKGNIAIGNSTVGQRLDSGIVTSGGYSMTNDSNIFIGYGVCDETDAARYSTFIGYQSGADWCKDITDQSAAQYAYAHYNTALGAFALHGNGTPYGSHNTAIGSYAMADAGNSTLSRYNTCIGAYAGDDIEGDSNVIIGSQAGSNVGGATAMADASGNVIIGVNASGSSGTAQNQIVMGNAACGGGDNIAVIGNGSCTQLWAAEDKGATVYCSNVIADGGVTLIGRTSIAATSKDPILEIDGYVSFDGFIERAGTGGSDNGGNVMNFNWDGTYIDGWVDTSEVWPNETSDYRIKENVVNINNGILEKINALRPIQFTQKAVGVFTKKDEARVSFIAHELQEQFPDIVKGTKDEVNDDDEPIFQSYNNTQLTAYLVKAVQELSAKVAALEAQIN